MLKRSVGHIILLAVLALALVSCGDTEVTATLQSSPPPPAQAPASVVQLTASILGVSVSGSASDSLQPHQDGGSAFAVNLEDPEGSGEYKFDPADLKFSVGDVVNFTVTSESEFHTFTVSELEIDVFLEKGESAEFSFAFKEAGTYKLVCIPHESLGMVSTITVE